MKSIRKLVQRIKCLVGRHEDEHYWSDWDGIHVCGSCSKVMYCE